MQLSHDFPCRLARLTFTLMMGVAWCGGATRVARAADPAPAPADQAAKTEQAIAQINRLIDALDVANRQLVRDTFDPQAVLAQVGRRPDALFAWVRDNTHWVPYEGTLRGPSGVLMDRVGNSLDRALLLAELLRLSGVPVRLARAPLAADAAARAVAEARPVPALVPTTAADGGQSPEQMAASLGIDPVAFRQAIEKQSIASYDLAEEALRQSAQHAPTVLAAVPAPAAPDAAATTAGARKAAADHWWVEAKTGGDAANWTAFDPHLPTAAPGTPGLAAEPSATFEPGDDGRFALPADRLHTVEVRVVVEQWKDGKATEAVALAETLRPSDVLGSRVVLRHRALKWPKDEEILKDPDPMAKYRATAAAQKEWLPMLLVGEGVRTRASVTAAGELNEDPKMDGAAAIGAQMGGMFGGLTGGGGEEDGDAAGALTAEWVEYVVRAPGRPDRVERRQVFDLRAAHRGNPAAPLTVDDAAKVSRGLAVLGETEMLLLPCQLSSEFVVDLTNRALVSNRALFEAMRRDTTFRDPDNLIAEIRKATPPPSRLYTLAVVRRDWSPVRGDVYLDRANVLSLHTNVDPDTAGVITARQAVDVVANDVAVRAGAKSDPFAARVRQGVADTAAEAVMMTVVGGGSAVSSATAAFARAAARGDAAVTLRRAEDLTAAALKLPADLRHRVAQDLAAGYVVVLPAAEMPDSVDAWGWWRIDPKDGRALGMGGTGYGNALVESSLKTKFAVTLGVMIFVGEVCIIKFGFLRGRGKIDAADLRTCACASVLAGFAVVGMATTGNPQLGVGMGGLAVGGLCA
ncbi:MAG TPA: hypothetical protein VK324_09755 [Tepidisphaeraceae bacterium]|nr:hypothetical protein [Tepidisphaeraceae bacterium]